MAQRQVSESAEHSMRISVGYDGPARARRGSFDEPPTKLKFWIWGARAWGRRSRATPAVTRRPSCREKHPVGAVGGGVEQLVRRAAQRRRLPGVGHHMQAGAVRAEDGYYPALPVVAGPPVEHSPAHTRSAQVAGRHCIDREACRRDWWGRTGGAGERLRWWQRPCWWCYYDAASLRRARRPAPRAGPSTRCW